MYGYILQSPLSVTTSQQLLASLEKAHRRQDAQTQATDRKLQRALQTVVDLDLPVPDIGEQVLNCR